MKKHLAILITIVVAISSCEKDDFCTQNPVTPNLVLRFYNKDTVANTKNVQRLSVIAQGKSDSLFTNRTLDSITIPLNSLTQQTIYTLKMNNSENGTVANNKIATLTVKYTPKEEFVSRSCGYRVIFNNVTLEKTLWIDSLSTKSIETINSQNNAHVKIYH